MSGRAGVPERPWDRFVTERDRQVFDRSGYGAACAPAAGARTAVLVIDMTVAFLGDRPEPLLRSVERFPNSCGEEGWTVARRLAGFLSWARGHGLPVVYTVKDVEHAGIAAAAWGRTRAAGPQAGGDAASATVVPPLAPEPGDVVVRKTKPSAFFSTPLLQQLLAWDVRQVVCCGATTSGCVRATAVDAFSHGFVVVVPDDGVCDRGEASHAVGLFDLAQKYAAVTPLAEVMARLAPGERALYPPGPGTAGPPPGERR